MVPAKIAFLLFITCYLCAAHDETNKLSEINHDELPVEKKSLDNSVNGENSAGSVFAGEKKRDLDEIEPQWRNGLDRPINTHRNNNDGSQSISNYGSKSFEPSFIRKNIKKPRHHITTTSKTRHGAKNKRKYQNNISGKYSLYTNAWGTSHPPKHHHTSSSNHLGKSLNVAFYNTQQHNRYERYPPHVNDERDYYTHPPRYNPTSRPHHDVDYYIQTPRYYHTRRPQRRPRPHEVDYDTFERYIPSPPPQPQWYEYDDTKHPYSDHHLQPTHYWGKSKKHSTGRNRLQTTGRGRKHDDSILKEIEINRGKQFWSPPSKSASRNGIEWRKNWWGVFSKSAPWNEEDKLMTSTKLPSRHDGKSSWWSKPSSQRKKSRLMWTNVTSLNTQSGHEQEGRTWSQKIGKSPWHSRSNSRWRATKKHRSKGYSGFNPRSDGNGHFL